MTTPGHASVVFGGRGAVGRLFVDLLAAVGPTVSADLAAPSRGESPSAQQVTVDATTPAVRAARPERADTVVLALPEPVIERAAETVAAAMSPGALLVHTASVQTAGAAPVDRAAHRHGLVACGVDPMFAPALGTGGRPVVVTSTAAHRHHPLVRRFVAQLEDAGARVEQMSPEEHDAITADQQVAVHAAILAFGEHLRSSEHPLTRHLALATPPFRTLVMLLARIASGEPEVYRAIQHEHPGSAATRESLHRALETVATTSADPHDFAGFMRSVQDWLGDDRDPLATRCARLFDGFGETGPDR